MSTLTLDFTDSSFDDALDNGITDFVLSNQGGGLGVFSADGNMGPNDALLVDNDINVAAGISAMEITTNAGTEFTFEFLDEDGDGERSTGDAYSSAAVDHHDGSEIFNVGISEAFFADGIDITNGDSIQVDFIEKGYSNPGTPGTVTPKEVQYLTPGDPYATPMPVGTLGHNGSAWVFDETDVNETVGDWSTVSAAITNAGGNAIDIWFCLIGRTETKNTFWI